MNVQEVIVSPLREMECGVEVSEYIHAKDSPLANLLRGKTMIQVHLRTVQRQTLLNPHIMLTSQHFRIITIIIFLISVQSARSQERPYKITGHIQGVENEFIYLKNKAIGMRPDFSPITYDSCYSIDGSFEFRGTFKEPDFYSIEVAGNEKDWVPFWISERVQLTAHKDSLYRTASVHGSAEHDFYANTRKEIKTLFLDEYTTIAREYVKYERHDSLRNVLDSIGRELGNYFIEKINTNPGLYAPIYFVMNDFLTIPIESAQIIYGNLSEAQKGSKYGNILKSQLSVIKVGDPALYFQLNDYQGNAFDLTMYKGKYILLDFWASWCIPCLEELPAIRTISNNYEKNNLQIVAVSLDTDHEKWVRSIEKNQMSWPNVSDLKGISSDLMFRYGVMSIPKKVLISPDGLVLLSTTKIDELEEYLSTTMK